MGLFEDLGLTEDQAVSAAGAAASAVIPGGSLIVETVSSLFGPGYIPSGGGEIRRQNANWPSDKLNSYVEWCKTYDPAVYSGAESEWDEPHYSKKIAWETAYGAAKVPGGMLDGSFKPVVKPQDSQTSSSAAETTNSSSMYVIAGIAVILVSNPYKAPK